jgi:broad specificity phosphatase PhoE
MSETHWLSEPSTASKRIIFARHGEYPCNIEGVCNSNPHTGFYLTEKGEAQARALGERLRDEKIELIVTSEFLRARQTAWLANEVLNVPQVVNRLANENRVGAAFEGKSGDDFQRFIAHAPSTSASVDGEPFIGLLERMKSLIADLKLSSPKTVLVVTHGWPLQAVRVILNEIGLDDAARCLGMPSNCDIVEGMF